MKKCILFVALAVLAGSVSFAQLTVNITANPDTVCSGNSSTLTANVTGGTPPYTYQWNGGPGTMTWVVTPLVTTTYTCVVLDQASSTAMGTVTVTVITVPSQPSAINGDNNPCKGKINLPYSVTNEPGVTYTWSIAPATASISAGNGTYSISVSTGNTGSVSGTITVVPSNVCGNGPAQTLSIYIASGIPANPSTISGAVTPCEGTSQTYSVTNTANVDYNWTLPSGWIITSGAGTNIITVTVGATSGTVSVFASNGCGDSGVKNLSVTVTPLPAMPDSITGPLSPSPGSTVTYCTNNVPGITYLWTVPAGWTITSGQGTYCITVLVGSTSGCVTVTPSNACGPGPTQSTCGTGLREYSPEQDALLEIIPNPANTEIKIIFNDASAESVQLSIVNLSGQTVYTGSNEVVKGGFTRSVDISELSSGTYFIRIITDNNMLMKKLVVLH